MQNQKIRQSNLLNFYSNDIVVSKDHVNLNYLKLIYQIILLIDLENKHKKWAEDTSFT